MSELKLGIILNEAEVKELLECVEYRIGQLKSEIRARNLNPQSYKSAFKKLIEIKKRLIVLMGDIKSPGDLKGVILDNEVINE